MNDPRNPGALAVATPSASDNMLGAILEAVAVGIIVAGPDGRRLKVNRTFCEMSGYTEAELLALEFHEQMHPDDRDQSVTQRSELFAQHCDRYTAQRRYLRKDATWFWASITVTLVRDADGQPLHAVAVVEDITARRAADAELRESEERFRATFEDAPFALAHYSGNGRWLRVNRKFVDLFGYPFEQLAQLDWSDLNHPEEREQRALSIGRLERGEVQTVSREKRYLRSDGSVFWGYVSTSAVRDHDGGIDYLVSTIEDVTQRVLSQQRLRESEARNRLLALVVEQSSDAIMIKDLHNRVVTWNPGAEKLYGYTAAEASGQNLTRLLLPNVSTEQVEARIAQLRLGVTRSRRNINLTRDGRRVEVEIAESPLLDEQGVHIGEISVTRDMTERLAAQRALIESKARNQLLAAVVEQTAEAIITKDLDNIVLSWNRGASTMFGYSAAEAIGRNISRLVIPDADEARVAAGVSDTRACRTYTRFEVRQTREGRAFDVEASYSPLFDAQGVHIGEISIARDITARLAAEQALRASEAKNRLLAAVVEQSSEGIIIKDLDNIVVSWNAGAERIYGWPAADAIGRNLTLLMGPDSTDSEVTRRIAKLRRARADSWRTRGLRRDGVSIHIEVNVSPLHDEDGRHIGEITISRDISERITAEEALRDHQLFLEQAQAVGGIGSWAVTLGSDKLTWSDETLRIFGIARAEFGDRVDAFWSLVHPEDIQRVRATVAKAIADRSTYTNEFRIIRADGTMRWVHEHAAIISDEANRVARIVGVTQDVTDRRVAQERIEFLATRDPLTELPNRLLLRDRIDHGMASASRNGTLLALLFIDLDRFKTINDSLGHRVGDEMLKQVADRLARCVREEDTLARLGGDEFVVLLEGLQDAQAAASVARKVLKLLSRPYTIEGHQLSTSCSIGISLFPTDGEDAQALMKNSDAAMYHAKERGRGNYQYFSASLHSHAVERLSIETALRRALNRDEFELHFQPQVRMDDASVVGMEALLRWHHPEEGLIPPARFIRIAEESGLIVPLGEWALNAACAQVRRWLDQGLTPPRLAVNVSVGQLSRGFVRSVSRILQQHRIEGSQLELEMTESLLMQQVDENVKLLRRLGDLGVQVALDDFGTGYSSLAYLKKFPIDALKIDRTFVRDIVEDPDDSAITAAVISIGHHMQLRVVAEGVETAEQLGILQAMDCDEYQGYLFSRPVPAAIFASRFLVGTSDTPSPSPRLPDLPDLPDLPMEPGTAGIA